MEILNTFFSPLKYGSSQEWRDTGIVQGQQTKLEITVVNEAISLTLHHLNLCINERRKLTIHYLCSGKTIKEVK